MASFSQNVAPYWAATTSVGAYPKSNWHQSELPPSGAPKGSATASGTVAADGSLSITGLADGTEYFLTDSGGTVYLRYISGPLSAPVVSESQLFPVVTTVTVDHTLALTDAPDGSGAVLVNSAAAVNVTVPPNSSVAFPVGTAVEVRRLGTGSVTLVQGAGVTIEPNTNLAIAAQHTSVSLLKTATDTWALEAGSGAGLAGNTFTGEQVAPDFSVSGLTGAVAGTRFVGATASGAPATGTFLTGDFIVDRSGAIWVCTAGGSPGTWVNPAAAPSSGAAKGTTNPWRYGASAVAESMDRVLSGGAVVSLTSGRLALTKIEYWEGPVSTISIDPSAALDNPTNGLTNQWACLVRADTKTVIAVTADHTTTPWVADTPIDYAITGAPFTPPTGVPLWVGVAVVASSGLINVLRGRSVTQVPATPTPIPLGSVTAGNGFGVTGPVAVGTVLGTLTVASAQPYVSVR